jgi:hypothetical protein
MAQIQHSAISDSDRHEAKGASTAAINQALFANGDGTTTFRKINYSDLNVKPTTKGYLLEINSSNTSATQTPGATDTELQVVFGSGTSTSNVAISSSGAITFSTAGQYAVRYGLAFSGGTSGAVLFFRLLVNGNPLEPTHRVAPSANEITEFCETFLYDAAAGDILTFQISSDSAGAGVGGLAQASPNASGWSSTPTAEVSIYKFSGIQ